MKLPTPSRRWFLRNLLLSPLTIPTALRAARHKNTDQTSLPVTLRSTDCTPIEAPQYLTDWKRAPRIPILESSNSHLQILLEAIRRREIIYFEYNLRHNNLPVRQIKPHFLFHIGEPNNIYLNAWDYQRQDERTFRCCRMGLLLTAPWMLAMLHIDTPSGSQHLQQTRQFIQYHLPNILLPS